MSKIYTSASQLIGKTPLLELTAIEKKLQLSARLLAKLEYLNPAGSAKDRVALAMIEDAERRGILREGSVIIEPVFDLGAAEHTDHQLPSVHLEGRQQAAACGRGLAGL